jgi:hypothetical protein
MDSSLTVINMKKNKIKKFPFWVGMQYNPPPPLLLLANFLRILTKFDIP